VGAYLATNKGTIMIITNPFDYTNAVSDTEELTMSEKMVALTIARHFNWSEQNPAFPTNETIAKKAGCNPRTVIRAKATLIEKGWLSSKRRFNKSNYYTPSIPSANTALPISQSEISHNETSNSDTMSHDTMSLPMRHDVTSRGDTEYTLTNNITNNLTDNISSFAAWESEVISQEEENSFSDVIEEKELLETRGTSIPLDNLLNISKYLDSNLSLSDIKEEVNDKDTFFLIVKERKSRGIF
jgi:hypothetical protein